LRDYNRREINHMRALHKALQINQCNYLGKYSNHAAQLVICGVMKVV